MMASKKRSVPKGRHVQAPRHRESADEHAATELVMYIENESDLSPDGPRGQGRDVLLNALRKWKKGTYDPALAVKLFGYLVESGAKRYAKEFGSFEREWSTMFTPATRQEAAKQLEASFRKAAEHGEYEHVDTRTGAASRGITTHEGVVAQKPIPYDEDDAPEEEDTRDKRWIILYDEDALRLLSNWTGGQSDPLYAISSMGGANYAWVFEDAISNISSELARVQKIGRNKFQLGKGTFTKAEIGELEIIHDALQGALVDAPSEGEEMPERLRETSRGQSVNARKRGPTRTDRLQQMLPQGYSLHTYSPGDGTTRYRFFQNAPEDQSYFGPANGIYTALGYKEAEAFASGLSHG